jgi:ABC-type uncharacterized transport system involved in gliding motility auxiliary subunit
MAQDWIKTRQTKFTAYVTLYLLVILAVLFAANFLANRYNKTLDATANKRYTLSDQSKKIVQGLKGDMRITYFDDQTRFASARNLLERYSNLSPKVRVDYIDPVKKPQMARAAGFTRDSNIIVDSGQRKEPAKSLTEEEVTGAMIRSLKTQTRNVCFLSIGGEHSLDDQQATGFSVLKTLLERENYKTRSVTLKGNAPEPGKSLTVGQAPVSANIEIPKDCTVLVVGGPQVAYPKAAVDAIKQYMDGGGRTLFMLDDSLRLGREQPASDSPELLKLLADWGVTVNKDLVLDLSGLGQLFGLDVSIPLVAQYESHTITRPLQGIPSAFPFSRSLEVKSAGNSTVEKLFGTTENSVAVSSLPPDGKLTEKDLDKGKKGPLTIGAAGTVSTGNTKSRFIVTGTSQWARNDLAGSGRLGNRDLLTNMINWLSSDEDLISIRPKETENQTLNMTGQRGTLMFWLSVVIFPLAVVGMGLGTWWQRR